MNAPLSLGLIGPLPPPSGGMAMQTLQLESLLRKEGLDVKLLQTNAPYKPAFIKKIPLVRSVFRLIPYFFRVWRLTGRVDVIHLMSNSGWSWQLFSAPVLWLAWLRKTPVIVNYHGGEARDYLQKSASRIKPSLSKAATIVVPSHFLEQVFSEYGFGTRLIPNIIDLESFYPRADNGSKTDYSLVITRNLEPIYGLDTAIRCIAIARESIPGISLKVAGSGPQLRELQQLVHHLGLDSCVSFLGRLESVEIAALCQSADAMLNPSLADNMPVSVLEALACGLPVISTNVGGVPYLVEDGETALLVEPCDAYAMARAVVRLYSDEKLQDKLRKSGLKLVEKFAWPAVKEHWLGLYRSQAAPI